MCGALLATSHQESLTRTGHHPEVDFDQLAEVGSSRMSPQRNVVLPFSLEVSP